MLNLPTGQHYESEVRFDPDPAHGIVVTKTYRVENECVGWLNRHLARYYEPSRGQPVAQHEFAALTLLDPYGFVPKPLLLRPDSIVMEFAGAPVSLGVRMEVEVYLEQCRRILATFARLNFRHNDLLPPNVLVHAGRVKIADFTLSEFGGIQIMQDLPNPDWARPGQDENILTFLSRGPRESTGALGYVRRLVRRIGHVSWG